MKYKVILFVSFILVSVIASFIVWGKGPNSLTGSRVVTIARGQSAWSIGQTLKNQGVIRNVITFFALSTAKGFSGQLKAGTYRFEAGQDLSDILRTLNEGDGLTITLIIPEGASVKEIEDRLSQNGKQVSFNKVDWDKLGQKYSFIIEAVTIENNFVGEGYLFPDTYELEFSALADSIAGKMIDNFSRKVSPFFEEIKEKGLSLREVVIVASLIEREVKLDRDRALVSDIIWRRLKAGMPLQIDATIVYAKVADGQEKKPPTKADLGILSPYNTYLHMGLPPGAIANPGLGSLEAALKSKNNEFWYYLSKSDGSIVYSRTLEEHNLAKAKYLR